MLYSSANTVPDCQHVADSNYFLPFKIVNATIVQRLTQELEQLGDPDEEGMYAHCQSNFHYNLIVSPLAPCALVGALTKTLCCVS
jgi:transcription initiation factor TFIIH subunit 3